MRKMKVAVTGAGGQVGSVLVRRMLDLPHIDTIAVCRNAVSAGLVDSFAPGCEIRIGSITERTSAQQVLGDCDVIINCALAMISGKPKMARILNKAMIDGFSHLEKLKLLIHLSSVGVYGRSIDSAKCSKSIFERPRPDYDYGRSKLSIERYVKRMCSARGLRHYILRVGHVIGANMDRSKEIIALAHDPNFHLPFNGELPSNTIHVEILSRMIIELILEKVEFGIYNVADERKTWRHVFDWHTQSLGLKDVKGIPSQHSEYLKASVCSDSVIRSIATWVRSLPVLDLVRYPGIFDYVFRFLYLIPSTAARRLAGEYKRLEIKRQIKELRNRYYSAISPVYFSDGMPGVHLTFPSESRIIYPSWDELSEQLRKWYHQYSQPNWLPNSI